MNKRKLGCIAACASVTIAVVSVVMEMIDEEEKEYEAKRRKTFLAKNKVAKESLNFMANNPIYYHQGRPQFELPTRVRVEDLFYDPNRNYCKIFTSLYGWEFFTLAEKLKPFIETSRNDPTAPMGNRMKKDYRSRLYYTLYWLTTLSEWRQMEFYFGWSKAQFAEDIPHVLRAIIRALDDFLEWPTQEEREMMCQVNEGIFKNCVGIIDASEKFVVKSKNKTRENSTYSGKQGGNTRKVLAVIDRKGRFRFLVVGTNGGTNDRDQFTSSALFLKRNEFFSFDQFLSADGIYRGVGPVLTSFNAKELASDPDGSRAEFQAAFTEYRKGVENAFGRVQNWFEGLGNRCEKWVHDFSLLDLAYHAACRLHNWMMHVRNLDYDPTSDPQYLFTASW